MAHRSPAELRRKKMLQNISFPSTPTMSKMYYAVLPPPLGRVSGIAMKTERSFYGRIQKNSAQVYFAANSISMVEELHPKTELKPHKATLEKGNSTGSPVLAIFLQIFLSMSTRGVHQVVPSHQKIQGASFSSISHPDTRSYDRANDPRIRGGDHQPRKWVTSARCISAVEDENQEKQPRARHRKLLIRVRGYHLVKTEVVNTLACTDSQGVYRA